MTFRPGSDFETVKDERRRLLRLTEPGGGDELEPMAYVAPFLHFFVAGDVEIDERHFLARLEGADHGLGVEGGAAGFPGELESSVEGEGRGGDAQYEGITLSRVSSGLEVGENVTRIASFLRTVGRED
jgi:hypothetical protein